MPEVPVLPETALLWAGVSASACASREAASEEASLSAMAEAEVSSARERLAAPAALGGTCRGADGLHGDDAGRSASASRVSSPLMSWESSVSEMVTTSRVLLSASRMVSSSGAVRALT